MLPRTILLDMQWEHHAAVVAYKLFSQHTTEIIKRILALFGSLISNTVEETLPPCDVSSGGAVEVQPRIYEGIVPSLVGFKLKSTFVRLLVELLCDYITIS